jgi:hypothetical protein
MKGQRDTEKIYEFQIRKLFCLFRTHLQSVSLAVACQCGEHLSSIAVPVLLCTAVGKFLILGFYAPITALQFQFFGETESIDPFELKEKSAVGKFLPFLDISGAADFI